MSAPAPAGDRVPTSRPARLIVELPTRLALCLLWTTLVVSTLVLAGAFRPLTVVPLLLAVLGLTWRLRPERRAVTAEEVQGAAIAVGFVVLWILVNLPFVGQVLLVERDPGFLTLTGLWLRHNADPDIPLRSAEAVLAAVPGLTTTSEAYWLDGAALTAQGAKAFPGLIALGGWVAGQPGLLATNLLIGAVALLAVFDLARRLIGPRWALLPMVALALTTPMIYFSRTPFTEPLNIVLTCAGLVVAWEAVRRPRVAQFALAGALAGASALGRIDGAAVAAGLIVGLGLAAGGSRDVRRRRALITGFAVATLAALAMVALGYLDVRVHGAGYLADHADLYGKLIALLCACLIGAVTAIALPGPRLRAWVAEHRDGLGWAAAAVMVLVGLVLASRPLWMTAHLVEAGTPMAAFIEAFQRDAGVPVDGTRSYDESTMIWLAWYLGVATVVLGWLGAAGMAREAIRARHGGLLIVLATLGVPSLVYLVRPSITPDQVWAMRRLLPAALPLVLLGAAWLLHRLWQGSQATALSRAAPSGRARRGAIVALAAAMLLAPAAAWGGLLGTAQYQGRAGEVAAMCARIPPGSHVVAVRGQEPPLLPTLRIVCDVDVVELPAPASAADLATIHAAWGGGRLFVVGGLSDTADWGGGPTLSTAVARWPHALLPGGHPVRFTSELWIGTVDADGAITPVPAA